MKVHATWGEERRQCENYGSVIATFAQYRTVCGCWLDDEYIAYDEKGVTCLACQRTIAAVERDMEGENLEAARADKAEEKLDKALALLYRWRHGPLDTWLPELADETDALLKEHPKVNKEIQK